MAQEVVLIVDDDELIRETLRLDLLEQGLVVDAVSSGEEALALFDRKYDLIITDLVMDGMSGLEVLRRAKEMDPECVVFILTGHRELEAAIGALRLGADDYLIKPYAFQEMVERVTTSLQIRADRQVRRKPNTPIISICSDCKKIRTMDQAGQNSVQWVTIEHFLHQTLGTDLSHGICPECYKQKMAELTEMIHKGQLFRPS